MLVGKSQLNTNIKSRPGFRPLIALWAMLLLLTGLPGQTIAKNIYTYKDKNGNVLITDRPRSSNKYTLTKKTYIRPFRDRRSGQSNHAYFSKGITSQYDALINNLALNYDVEPAFIKAVVHVESAFNPKAVSHAGAMGLMQLMPQTAKLYNLTTNPFDPERNLVAGIRHMQKLLNRYDGNKTLSLAAYNAGEGAVSKYKGIPPYAETQDYVGKVLKLYNKYRITYSG